MVAVAVVAPFLMLLRDSSEEGEFLIGALIVGGCVATLAYKLASDEIARKVAGGKLLSRRRKLGVALISTSIALAFIGTADLAFFFTYEAHVRFLQSGISDYSYYVDIQYLGLVEGAVVALVLGVCWKFVLRHLKLL